MTPILTSEGYRQTKEKLANLEKRLGELTARPGPKPSHYHEVLRSYDSMIRQYRREIEIYEVDQSEQHASLPQAR